MNEVILWDIPPPSRETRHHMYQHDKHDVGVSSCFKGGNDVAEATK